MSFSFEFVALFLFILAGLTDYLDGYIARRTRTETSLGALLDLLADKLLICLVLLWCTFLSDSLFVLIATLLIVSRELIISSLRQFLVEMTGENPLKVTYIAKSKTTMQIIAISFLIICPQMGPFFNFLSVLLLWISALMSIYTLYNYLKSYSYHF
tara:strand:- start:253 stop:720 length:468 start_codon:yes stop_codon:yes gene_type:complete